MFCTRCGIELQDDDRFCRRCGARSAIGYVGYTEPAARPLMLDKRNKKVAGVCAGFARYMNVDVTLLRVLWLIVAFTTGVGFLAYLIVWIAIPSDEYGYAEARVTT